MKRENRQVQGTKNGQSFASFISVNLKRRRNTLEQNVTLVNEESKIRQLPRVGLMVLELDKEALQLKSKYLIHCMCDCLLKRKTERTFFSRRCGKFILDHTRLYTVVSNTPKFYSVVPEK